MKISYFNDWLLVSIAMCRACNLRLCSSVRCNCLREGCLRGCEPVRGCTCEGRQNPLRHTTQPVPFLICRLIGRETVDLASGWPSAFYYVWASSSRQYIWKQGCYRIGCIPGRAHPTTDVDGLIVTSCWICSAPAALSEKNLLVLNERLAPHCTVVTTLAL